MAYRLIAPGSEWKLHRDWFGNSAMADLWAPILAWPRRMDCTPAMTDCSSTRTRCSRTWSDAGATCSTPASDVLLYDPRPAPILRSTPHSCRKATSAGMVTAVIIGRDCPQVVIALVVTPEGLPLAYEVLPGNTADNQTLRQFLQQDRDAVRQGPARLGDGSRHSERGGAGRDAPGRSAGALSGGHSKGPPDPGWRSISSTSPGREARRGCPGQTAGPGRRVLCLRPKRRPRSSRRGRCAGAS